MWADHERRTSVDKYVGDFDVIFSKSSLVMSHCGIE